MIENMRFLQAGKAFYCPDADEVAPRKDIHPGAAGRGCCQTDEGAAWE
jgi:hypothetical protein